MLKLIIKEANLTSGDSKQDLLIKFKYGNKEYETGILTKGEQ